MAVECCIALVKLQRSTTLATSPPVDLMLDVRQVILLQLVTGIKLPGSYEQGKDKLLLYTLLQAVNTRTK